MHLAVLSGDAAILLQDHGRIVINTARTALEKGQDQDDAHLAGQGPETLRRRAGNRLRQVTKRGFLLLAEI